MFAAPSAQQAAAAIPAGRGRVVDAICVLALVAVVAGHAPISSSRARNDRLEFGSALARPAVFQRLASASPARPASERKQTA